MTVLREIGDVVRLTVPHGAGKQRLHCCVCRRLLAHQPEPVCPACGIIYRPVIGGDYQVVSVGSG